MRSTHLIVATAVLLELGAPAPASAGDIATESFVLAIEHFDPQHERGIAWFGEEAKFVSTALAAVIRVLPELSSVHNWIPNPVSSSQMPRPLMSLQVLDPISKNPWLLGDWDYAQRFAATAVDGCRGSRTTEEFDNGRGNWHQTQSATRLVFDEMDHALADTSCERTAVANWLCAAKIASVTIETRESDRGPRLGQLYLNFHEPVDLHYEASRIMDQSGYEELFGKARLQPYPPMLAGGSGDHIEIVKDEDCVGFKGIALLFSHGWGDCPSGCLHRHYWRVKVRARVGQRGENRWVLAVTNVEEWGDVLSPESRAVLSAGAMAGGDR